jgi:hypothetical protein
MKEKPSIYMNIFDNFPRIRIELKYLAIFTNKFLILNQNNIIVRKNRVDSLYEKKKK